MKISLEELKRLIDKYGDITLKDLEEIKIAEDNIEKENQRLKDKEEIENPSDNCNKMFLEGILEIKRILEEMVYKLHYTYDK